MTPFLLFLNTSGLLGLHNDSLRATSIVSNLKAFRLTKCFGNLT
uniref:Uncharacterized protein n=1 Tax=Arundo donax TaxID=35708 RepID=A0A0A9HD11_ARUDO